MRTADQWLSEYGESHQNPTNKLIHWICVPLIVLTVFGILWSVHIGSWLGITSPWANLATLTYLVALIFYFRTSVPLALGMMVVCGLMLVIIRYWEIWGWNIPLVSISIFVLAWIGQFYGHKVEGKKPSFLKDVQFLLIGPMWLLHFIYKKVGITY